MTEKTRIYLIRHGEVEGAGTRRYNGHADVSLSERGIAQYHLMKERLADREISCCYTSDLTRCAVGAGIICSRLGLSPVRERNLRELDIGVWEGKTWAELQSEYPREWQARLDDIVNYRVPGGECLNDLHARILPVINTIAERHRGENVLVVAHGGANRVILLDAIGAPLASLFNIEQDYCCLNIIEYYADGKAVVKLLNG
jgi:alpha-ribazole phosphatase